MRMPDDFEEVRENRHFDRWIVNLADFLQTEKFQLFAQSNLNKSCDDPDWTYKDIDHVYEQKLDDQLYEVYRSSIPTKILVKHGLTKKEKISML